MTVIATCHNCKNEQLLADRICVAESEHTTQTTRCPTCGKKGYTSSHNDTSPKSETERIRDVVTNIDGVGAMTETALLEEFDSYVGLEKASVSRLTDVDGVGQKTAQRIQEKVR